MSAIKPSKRMDLTRNLENVDFTIHMDKEQLCAHSTCSRFQENR
jgi:protein-arginine kinase